MPLVLNEPGAFFMLLDLEDQCLKCRITVAANGRLRLTLEYPSEYGPRVLNGLADLLRTNTPVTPNLSVPIRRVRGLNR